MKGETMDLTAIIALHVLNNQKYVEANPAVLAAMAWEALAPTVNLKCPHVFDMSEKDQAELALNVYSLASCGRSEEQGSAAGELAIMWAVHNACTGLETPARKLLRSMRSGAVQASDGHFGAQEAPGKWACTRLPPTEYTLTKALLLLTDPDATDDVTHGSTLWIGWKAQDAMHSQNPQLYTKSSADIVAERELAGYHVVHLTDVPNTWFFAHTQYPQT
jgi:hypothetical protein